ncbi:MAG TPA: OsmC family protein [Gammaproteobacteria bacterium]
MHEIAITSHEKMLQVTRADGVSLSAGCDGNADGFSAIELLAAALGSCIGASLTPLLLRHGASDSQLRVTLRPRGEALEHGLIVVIALPSMDDALRQRCRRAVAVCPVVKALNIPVELHWQDC